LRGVVNQPELNSEDHLQIRTDNTSPSIFQKELAAALQNIAALKPDNWSAVSETALVVASTKGLETKPCRDLYRTAFELLSDRGFVRRDGNCWIFKQRFTSADAADVANWSGIFKIDANAKRIYGK
jgi:hypothetical protein